MDVGQYSKVVQFPEQVFGFFGEHVEVGQRCEVGVIDAQVDVIKARLCS